MGARPGVDPPVPVPDVPSDDLAAHRPAGRCPQCSEPAVAEHPTTRERLGVVGRLRVAIERRRRCGAHHPHAAARERHHSEERPSAWAGEGAGPARLEIVTLP
jgi:hypothetical protein